MNYVSSFGGAPLRGGNRWGGDIYLMGGKNPIEKESSELPWCFPPRPVDGVLRSPSRSTGVVRHPRFADITANRGLAGGGLVGSRGKRCEDGPYAPTAGLWGGGSKRPTAGGNACVPCKSPPFFSKGF